MNNDSAIQTLKVYLFPTLVSILSAMIWYDVSEIKKDVKALMAQSNIDKTRIDNLEKQIDRWHSGPPTANTPMQNPNPDGPTAILFEEFILDMPRKRVLLEEEAKKKPNIHA